MLKPLTTRSAQTGKDRVRLYASPQFVRPDGHSWVAIHGAVRIVRSGETFRVTYGKEWAEIGPIGALVGLQETVTASGHFGWRLDASKAPDGLAWSLKHSKGAERVGDGVVLGRPDGIPLGLFWADWQQHKPRLSGDELMIDVSAAKARAVNDYELCGAPKDSYPLLDLDPTTLALVGSQTLWLHKMELPPPPAKEVWDWVRDGTDAEVAQNTIDAIALGGTAISAYFYRAGMLFDTSDYAVERLLSATLHMYFADGGTDHLTSGEGHVSYVGDFSGSWELADYGKIRGQGGTNGYDNNPIGYLTNVAEGNWCEIDVASEYVSESAYGLGLAHTDDVEDNYAGAEGIGDFAFTYTGGNAPYLELTVNPCYRLYRGVGTIKDVDFDTEVDTLLTQASEITSVGLTHAASTRYTYVLRPVRWYSAVEVETPDLSCAVEMTTDSEGEWVGARPPAVRNVEAFVEDSGEVRVRWYFRLDSGQTAPVNFGVWYGTSSDVDTSGAANTSVTYTRPNKFYEHTFTLADGVAYWFAVKARTATNASDAVVDGPYIADSTAPDAPTLISGPDW